MLPVGLDLEKLLLHVLLHVELLLLLELQGLMLLVLLVQHWVSLQV